MADISYTRVVPGYREGATGLSEAWDLTQGEAIWFSPPDRVATVTLQVTIPDEETAEYTVEVTAEPTKNIGSDGECDYWIPIEWEYDSYTISSMFTPMSAVTGIRVYCESADSSIHVAVCG